jgi:N-acetylmuramoyl-L-alanine amidase CwlA
LENDSENKEMCELETPKISKVLDIVSEMMNWMKRESEIISSFTFTKHYDISHKETPSAVMSKENTRLFQGMHSNLNMIFLL